MRPIWLLLVALPLAACGGTIASETPTAVSRQIRGELSALQLSVLEEIREAVEEDFVYPDLGGADWE